MGICKSSSADRSEIFTGNSDPHRAHVTGSNKHPRQGCHGESGRGTFRAVEFGGCLSGDGQADAVEIIGFQVIKISRFCSFFSGNPDLVEHAQQSLPNMQRRCIACFAPANNFIPRHVKSSSSLIGRQSNISNYITEITHFLPQAPHAGKILTPYSALQYGENPALYENFVK